MSSGRCGWTLATLALLAAGGCGQTLTSYPDPVILFSPIASTSVYLMSLDGQLLHEWKTSDPPGYSVYLLPNGNLLRANSLADRPLSATLGSNGGRVEMLDWESKTVWRFDYATTAGQPHPDLHSMPTTSHVLIVALQMPTAAGALAPGRP